MHACSHAVVQQTLQNEILGGAMVHGKRKVIKLRIDFGHHFLSYSATSIVTGGDQQHHNK